MHGAPGCVTGKLIPAIVNDPVRGANVLFCVTVNPTVPLPLPVCPKEIVTQVVLLLEVHAHVEALAETVTTESLLVLVGKLALAGVSWNVHWATPGSPAHTSSAANIQKRE